jgi:preprotein translocase subunit YajC
MPAWEFWIYTSAISILIGIVIYYNRRQQKKRDEVERKLIDSIDALKEAISQLKISISSITVGCHERHTALNREVNDIKQRIYNIETTLEKK